MSEYGSLYIIGTDYNASRDAYEVTIGYMERDEDVHGRFKSIKVAVSVSDHKGEESTVLDIALKKARNLLKSASKASVELE